MKKISILSKKVERNAKVALKLSFRFCVAAFQGAEKSSLSAKARLKNANSITDFSYATLQIYFAPLIGGIRGIWQHAHQNPQ